MGPVMSRNVGKELLLRTAKGPRKAQFSSKIAGLFHTFKSNCLNSYGKDFQIFKISRCMKQESIKISTPPPRPKNGTYLVVLTNDGPVSASGGKGSFIFRSTEETPRNDKEGIG
jgi:hypothetical protein